MFCQRPKHWQDLPENSSKYAWKIIIFPLIEFVEKMYFKKIVSKKLINFFDDMEALLLNGTTAMGYGPVKIMLFMTTR